MVFRFMDRYFRALYLTTTLWVQSNKFKSFSSRVPSFKPFRAFTGPNAPKLDTGPTNRGAGVVNMPISMGIIPYI